MSEQQTAAPQYAPQAANQIPQFSIMNPDDQRNAGSLAHLLGFFTGVLGTWFAYLVFRDRGPLIRQHYAAALNFQLSFALYTVVLGLIFVVPVLNILLGIAVVTLRIIFGIKAAKQAHRGQFATIPLTITFVR